MAQLGVAAAADQLQDRWTGIVRPYTQSDVERLRGSLRIEHTLAAHGARRLWEILHTEPFVNALGALTGSQAVQQAELAAEEVGYTATRHQREVGTGYFDRVSEVVSGGTSSTLALENSTERSQF